MKTHRQPASRLARLLIPALLLGTALTMAPAYAQDAATPAPATAAPAPEITLQTVVATVGGEPITEGDISFAAEDLSRELAPMPPEQRKAFLLNVLIGMKLMAKAAREQQMDQTETYKMRLQYLEEQALRRAYFDQTIATAVTPEQLQAAYEQVVAAFPAQEEVHARHILVATEDEAKAIKTELEGGKDFAELAKEKSTDPSAQQNGGDLGFFTKGMMVKPFEDAAFTMEVGSLSAPIKSDFGWHILKLEEKRMTQPPKLEEISRQLEDRVVFANFEAAIAALKEGVTIDIPDATLAEGVRQQNESAAAEMQ